MKGIVFLPVALLAMSIQLVRSAEVPALIKRPASENGPTQVSVGIWIVDINNIDSAQHFYRRHRCRVALEGCPPCVHGNRSGALHGRSNMDSAREYRE